MNFDKWWPCLKKHTKRVKHLLPYAKHIKTNLNSARPFRYFTLCAPPMIDVFMLAKEDVLDYDEARRAIDTVVFCEYNQERRAQGRSEAKARVGAFCYRDPPPGSSFARAHDDPPSPQGGGIKNHTAAIVCTSTKNCSFTSRSMMSSVFGGYFPLGNIFGNSRRRNAMNFGMSCEWTR